MRDGIPLDFTVDRPDPAQQGSDNEIAAKALMHVVLRPPEVAPGVVAAVHLVGAKITGHVSLDHASIGVPITIKNCHFDQPVRLEGARTRAVDLSGSRFPVLAGAGLLVDGDLTLHKVKCGRLSLFRAAVEGNVWLTRASISSLLDAPQMSVKGGIYGQSLTVRGQVNLWGVRAFTLELDHASVTHDSEPGLRMTGVRLEQDLEASHLSVTNGGIDLFGAIVGGQLRLEHATLRNTQRWAVRGSMLTVGGNIYGRGMTADGGMDLAGASVGASIELSAARLTAHLQHALVAPAVRIGGRMSLNHGAHICGTVELPRSKISGILDFSEAEFTEGSAIDLGHADVGILRMIAMRQPPTVLDLRTAVVGSLEDDPACWPAYIRSAMCTYQSLHPLLPATQRLSWLQRTDHGYHPQPYERLASHYRGVGHDDEARTVAVARHRQRRRSLPLTQRLWSHLEDATIGYGYRPIRALVWLLTLTAIVAVVFATDPPRPAQPNGPQFQPVVYAVDIILPILDMKQERAFVPAGGTQWVEWTSSLAGWLLATTAIAGLTRRLVRL